MVVTPKVPSAFSIWFACIVHGRPAFGRGILRYTGILMRIPLKNLTNVHLKN